MKLQQCKVVGLKTVVRDQNYRWEVILCRATRKTTHTYFKRPGNWEINWRVWARGLRFVDTKELTGILVWTVKTGLLDPLGIWTWGRSRDGPPGSRSTHWQPWEHDTTERNGYSFGSPLGGSLSSTMRLQFRRQNMRVENAQGRDMNVQ